MHKGKAWLLVSALALGGLGTACGEEEVIPPPGEDGCRTCHGSLKAPSPPRSLSGATDPSDPSVGAHEAHVLGSRLGGPVACSECHLVPKTVDAPGHNDTPLPAELTWGPLAAKQDLAPVWSRETLTCQNNYCHGATLTGGIHPNPIWNVADGSLSTCGSCHGMPPPLPHPANDACEACHAPVAGLNQTLAVPSRHANGILDVVDKTGCSACHGSMSNEAPPRDLANSSALTQITVGAHQTHLAGGLSSRAVACVSCHQIPSTLEDPGHVDTGPPAELTFSGLALVGDATPAWDRSNAKCSNTYCHGGTFPGGGATPTWNVVDGTQATCGSCHGLPPAAPHPADSRCEMCHLPTAGPNRTIANSKTHVDGILQVATDNCTGCHGNVQNLAPPVDAEGRTATTEKSVGAHQTHLSGGNNARPVACQTCHLVPNAVNDVGHLDDKPGAEVIFSGLGAMPGSAPVFDESNAKCNNTYCHGATLGGGTLKNPLWTQVGGEQAGCGSCHGLPPPLPHPASNQCMLCHAPTAGPNLQIANPSTHIDGVLQATDGTCGDCHGALDSAAPPLDLAGQSDTNLESVGAHRSHIFAPSGISRPVPCGECHLVPQHLEDPGHVDTDLPAELSFGPLAGAGSARPNFDATTLTCAGSYCHGATLQGGGALVAPKWTTVDGSQAACGSCHGLPPGGTHPRDNRCELCHLPTAGPGQTIANPSTHIDGIVQAVTGCDSCHGQNGNSAPPKDLSGRSDVTELSVGAHQTHLSGGLLSKPLSCTECHMVPALLDSPGHIDTGLPAEITFGPIATMNAIPTWTSPTCGTTHCHAGPDAANPTPSWNVVNGTEAVCGSCHGTPPNTPVHQSGGDCANCHLPTAGPNMTIANRATHVDGILQAAAIDCSTCHGGPAGPAPPKDLDGDTDPSNPQVGAHQAHLSGGLISAAVPCTTCHLVPAVLEAPGHVDSQRPAEVIWSGLASAQLLSPTFDPTAETCANTYCHGGATSGGTNTAPVWNVPGSAECGSCHGLPPSLPHPQRSNCETCHGGVVGANQIIIDPTRHVDGIIDVDVSTCDACHGSPGDPAPPRDLDGMSDRLLITVGAHQTHLSGGASSKAVACNQCHVVPVNLNDPGHIDSAAPAELIFGNLATAQGASPVWDRSQGTCANSYCHGSTYSLTFSPVWNVADGTQAECGSCHGLPPSSPHPQNTQCELCHLPTAAPGLTVADRDTHVDGIVQVSVTGCTGCHGNGTNLAPPTDVGGQSATNLRSVGAHQTHTTGGFSSHPVACTDCHLVPLGLNDPGHVDTPLPAEVVFAGVSVFGGAAPAFSTTNNRCNNTYCHGGTLSGGSNSAPRWTTVNGSEAACGSCHGLPPPAPHPANDQCMLCHGPTAGPNLQIADRSTHIDGILQVTDGTCTNCHGAGANPAPPLNVARESSTTIRSIGAHRAHLEGTGGISRPVACNECHLIPQNLNDPGHVDTAAPAELSWGDLASSGGANPSFTAQSTCANTYCHGATLSGGTLTTPSWVTADGSQTACGTCHGNPPPLPHPADNRCDLCHLPTGGPNQTIADSSTHIDGILQVAAGCDSCHGSNGIAAPPRDLAGQTSTNQLTVGAHRAHLDGGSVSKPVACTECHLVPIALQSPGHTDTPSPAEVNFGPMAGQGTNPSWTSPTCANTYCHGGVGATRPRPTWNQVDGTQTACGSCHGTPPTTPVHAGGGECQNCHLPTAGPGLTIANRATHVDGIVQASNLACDSCHGQNGAPSPPRDLNSDTAPTDAQVGAHQAHLTGGAHSAPIACDNCHLLPATLDAPGHVDTPLPAELVWRGVAVIGPTTPAFDGATRSCTNTYCHGNTETGGTNHAPVWNTPGALACGSCHGMPPPAPHPTANNCEACHAPVAGPGQTIADRSQHANGVVDVAVVTCDSCHGSTTNAAPPRDLDGNGAPTVITVGAHQAHLGGGAFSRPVACNQCHLVPVNLNDPGHIDTATPAELTFGGLARSDGANPGWNRGQASCNNTYCHGSTLPGNAPSPVWTVADGTQAACGSCHGLPPAAPHPANDRCEMCHLPTAGAGMTIANRATHVDGTVQVSVVGCDGCHGTATNLAPPTDTAGQSSTSLPSVGAHQTHLSGGNSSHAVACDTCHLVPQNLNDLGHVDTPLPAEVTFTRVSRTGGANPAFSVSTNRCSNTYCHGGTLSGGSNETPSWVVVDGSQGACGSCHGLPPPLPHPANDQCMACHSPTAGPGLTIANRATHLDGVLQVADGSCDACHGSGGNSAPPVNVAGQSSTTIRSIGAHASHLNAPNGISRPVACTECHLVPQNVNDPAHVDTPLPAELNWGPLAAHGTSPSFNTTDLSCNNTYCHGSSLRDGTMTAPIWNVVDGSQSVCGSCHGLPPSGTHPRDDRCELCHLPTAGPNLSIADPTTHIDGVIQVVTGCDTCHGSNGVSAPPNDLMGRTATTQLTVGAHRSHLSGGVGSKPVACTECHVVPAEIGSPGHTDTLAPAEITFGPLAGLGATPAWATPRCNNTYCHAGPGASIPSPVWNVVDGTQAACGGCHGTPPNTPVHTGGGECQSCHLPTAGPGLSIANPATHVDGIVQASSPGCNGCHGGGGNAPPIDLNGDSAPTDPQVGAHAVHTQGGSLSAPVPCASCHLVPNNLSDPGHVDTPPPAELVWSGLAVAQGSSPDWLPATRTCANTYCHGNASSGGTNPDPVWNAPNTAQCGSCHGLPPGGSHPQVDRCEVCHAQTAGPNHTIINASRHVNGIVEVTSNQPCQACHGTAQSPAPPADLNGSNTSPRVGTHQAHLAGTGRSLAVPCSECHLTVGQTTLNQAGHYDTAAPAEVTFGVLARTGGLNPNENNLTCTNTYCHGVGLPGGTNHNPIWNGAAQTCTSCHGNPPPDAVHGNGTATQCQSCHPDTAGPGQTIINPARHVNGVVDTSATCDACHGQNGNPAPPRDLAGLTTSNKVGAHTGHLNPGTAAPVACANCHLVPVNYGDPGHADTPQPAEVNLIGLATQGGATPTYSAGQLRCNNTYCHGVSLPGGKTQVTWNDADGSERQCGACHGMPPPDSAHAGVSGPNACNTCHEDSAGPNQTIVVPSLHVDGTVQVSGGACDSCHGSPPNATNESYPGSAGAHLIHAGTLGFECATCHGNNGSGPNHDQGNGTVVRANVNIVFNPAISYPGGTTMRNGIASATYNTTNKTCQVGCHNPVIGNPPETPNLNVSVGWATTNLSCVGCHDTEGNAPPKNHNIAALGDAGCLACHNHNGHTTGTKAFVDPDPADGFAYAPGNFQGLCKTCHDGGTGTYFGGQSAQNVSPYWTTSSHGSAGYQCSSCHSYHGSTNGPAPGPRLLDQSNASCLASGCHATLATTDFNQVPAGPISHHRIEGGTGIQLACINCHNPHLNTPHPNAAIDPDNKWAVYALPTTARTQKKNQGNYTTFCLRCHDGTAPPGVLGAKNIATVLAGGTDTTTFITNDGSQHRKNHSGYNCQNCHDDHASSGSTGINRGHLLLSYIRVNNFNTGTQRYSNKGSCTTSTGGFGFGCH